MLNSLFAVAATAGIIFLVTLIMVVSSAGPGGLSMQVRARESMTTQQPEEAATRLVPTELECGPEAAETATPGTSLDQ
jgi:hypothetical protein